MSCFSASVKTATVAEPDPAKHVNYNLGMVLGVDDFTQEFAYLSGRDQWMARDLIGYGTVSGLRIGIDVDTGKGPRVVVEPGVAVSPRGQMICVPSAQCAYLKDFVASRSGEISHLSGIARLYVVLCYRDCPSDSVPIAGEPCRSEDELMAPSRLTDDFCLELRFNKPNQREEEAVRNYVEWLKQIEIGAAIASSTPLEQFLDAIRAEAKEWLSPEPSSPPTSPPRKIMAGSPPAFLHVSSTDACEYMRAALLLWVTELRPKWIARWHGCAPAHFDVDDQTEENCVLLGELIVPVASTSTGSWTVADHPMVEKDEAERPYVIHLRMLQEWVSCAIVNQWKPANLPVSGNFVEHPQKLPLYSIVAAGILKADGTGRLPLYDPSLTATFQPDTKDFLLSFDSYSPPKGRFQYIVKAMVVLQKQTEAAVVTFKSFIEKGILLHVSNVEAIEEPTAIELMVEISRYEGKRIGPPIQPGPKIENKE